MFDQGGGLITKNEAGTSGEQVSLAGQPAGTYDVEVYGLNGSTCPDYTLHFNVPGPDDVEPNDTRATAFDFGTVTGQQVNPYLSIDHPGDQDWFKFQSPVPFAASNAVSLAYALGQGDLEMELYDGSGTLLGSSEGSQASGAAQIGLAGRPAGTYFIHVFGPSGATDANYTVTINAPTPDWLEGASRDDTFATASVLKDHIPTNGGAFYIDSLSIDNPSDVDWYKFTTTRPMVTGDWAKIDGFHSSQGDIDLALFDSSQKELAASETADDVEQIGLAGLAAGTYYLRVQGYHGAVNLSYILSINLPGPDNREPNDDSAHAYDFGTVTDFQGWQYNSIDKPTDVDWFKFTTVQPGVPGMSVQLQHQLADGDLDLELYDSTGKTKLASSTGAHDNEVISLAGLPAGTYYARVFGADGATNPNYNIYVYAIGQDYAEPNGSRTSPYDLGSAQGHVQEQYLSINSPTDVDWFRFQTIAPAAPGNAASLSFQDAQGNLDLYLYDAIGHLIGSSTTAGDGERIDLGSLPAGTYSIEVAGYQGAVNPRYDLDLYAPFGSTGDTDEPNDSLANATDLRVLRGQETRDALSIGSGDQDWFVFQTVAPGVAGQSAFLDFNHSDGAMSLQLYDSDGNLLATTADASSDRQQVSLAGRPAGTYYLRVAGIGGATDPVYKLTVNPPGVAQPDWAEPNDTSPTAYALKTVQGLQTWAPLSIDRPGDVDWFSFQTAATGTGGDFAQITFNAAQGHLTLALFDGNGNLVNQASGAGNSLTISLSGLAAGTYRLRVAGADASTVNPSYTLAIQAPPAAAVNRSSPNHTLQTATVLGTLQGAKSWPGLSIASPTDEDWYRFDTSAPGTDADSVQLIFDLSRGTPAMALYDGQGHLLAATASAVPAAGSALQYFIVNNSSPWALRSLGLDPTKITSQQQLVQALLPYASKRGLTLASESLSLAGKPAGTYYVRATSAYQGQTVPGFILTIQAPVQPVKDWAEVHGGLDNKAMPNDDTLADAYDLGPLDGQKQWTGLSIDHAGDVDWLRFQLRSDGLDGDAAWIDFNQPQGDLDLNLYDTSGHLIASSAGHEGQEKVSLKGLKAGTYEVEVVGYENATNPAYSLTIRAPGDAGSSGDPYEPNNTRSSAYDLGPLEGVTTLGGNGVPLSIYDGGDEDWFSFQLVSQGQSSHFVRIQSDSTQGDIDLELYDSGGKLIAASGGLRDVEQVGLNNLGMGTYYIRVFGHNGSSNPSYTMTINSPGEDWAGSNHSRAAAYNFGAVQGQKSWDELTIDSSADDWFRFTVATAATTGDQVSVTPDTITALELWLYDAGGQVIADSGPISGTASVSLAGLAVGDYYVRVASEKYEDGPGYSLAITAPTGLTVDWSEVHGGLTDNDNRAHAYDLGTVRGLKEWNDPQHPLSIDHPGDEDWFRFQLASPGLAGQTATIDYVLAYGDLDLDLDDTQGHLLARSAYANNHESVSLAGLAAGTYYLRIYGFNNATNPQYALTIDAPSPAAGDWAEPNDTRAQAHDLRLVTSGEAIHNLSIDHPGDVDWFRFQTALTGISGQYVALDFSNALGDLDLRLFDTNGTLLDSSAGTGDGELISMAGRPVGVYYVEVVEADALTNPGYSLILFPPGPATGDWTEPNDTRATAKDLRQVDGLQKWTGLTIPTESDVDWFQFTLVGNGVDGDYVGLQQDLTVGDLDLALYDGQGNLLKQADGPSNFEQISLAGRAAGTYSIKVSGHQGSTSPSYSVWINAPHAPGSGILSDWAEPNDSLQAARDLGHVKGSQSWGLLSIDTSGNDDWYQFETIGAGADGQYVRIDYDGTQGNLGLALYAADGTPVPNGSSQVSGDCQQVSLAGLKAGTYFLKVSGVSGATNPSYSLTINAPASPDRDWAEAHAALSDDDSMAHALDLRSVNQTDVVTDLSINPTGDVDWFRFTTLADSSASQYVRIDFDHSQGALAFDLYDTDGILLGSSAGPRDSQQIPMAGRPKGTYYVRISGQNGATSPLYTLSISAPSVPTPGGDWAEVHGGVKDDDTVTDAYPLRDLQGLQSGKTPASRTGDEPTDGAEDVPDFNIMGAPENAAAANTSAVAYNQTFQQAAQIAPGILGSSLGQGTLENAGNLFNSSQSAAGEFGYVLSSGFHTDDWGANMESQISPELGTWVYLVDKGVVNGLTGQVNGQAVQQLQAEQNLLKQQTIRAQQLQAQQQQHSALLQLFSAFLTAQVIVKAKDSQTAAGGSYSTSSPPSGSSTSSGQVDSAKSTASKSNATETALILLFAFLASRGQSGAAVPVVLPNLQIDGPGDADVFSFQLAGDGQADESVRIDFDHSLGSLSLDLLDANGNMIDRSDDAGDSQQLGLDGLPAGTYYVRVAGIGGAANRYTLSLLAPPLPDPAGDWAEPDDSRTAARDLGTVQGTTTLTGLSIHTPGDLDWFRFTTAGRGGTVTLSSDPSLGDLDIALYDSNGALIARSDGTAASESVSLGAHGPGSFFIEVYGYEWAISPRYSLDFELPWQTIRSDSFEPNDSLAQAADLDGYDGTANLLGLTLQPGDQDYFQFDTSAAMGRNDMIELSGPSDLRIEVLDANGSRVRPTAGHAVGNSVDPTGLPAGHYYIHIYGATGQTSGAYDLHFYSPTPQPGPGTWTIMVYMTASDLESYAFQDINEMEDAVARLPGTVHLAIFLDQSATAGPDFATGGGNQPPWSTVGQAIIQPDTDPNTIATNFQVYSVEEDTGDPSVLSSFIGWAKQAAPAQKYGLIFWDHGDDLSGVNFDDADSTVADHLTIPDLAQALASSVTHFDLIAFDACKMAMAEVEYAVRSYAPVIVGSEEIEGGAGFDYQTAFSVLDDHPDGVDGATLAAGIVQSYRLQAQSTPGGPDTESAVATPSLGALAAALKSFTAAALNDNSASDWAVLRQARGAAAAFSNAPDDRDLGQFFQAIVSDPTIAQGLRDAAGTVLDKLQATVIAIDAGRRRTSGLSIELPAPGEVLPGDYLSVTPDFLKDTNWNAFLTKFISQSGGMSADADWAESNDTQVLAYNLHRLGGTGNTFSGLSLNSASDVDWFRFFIEATGAGGSGVRIGSDPSGTLSLSVVDDSGKSLAGSGGRSVSLAGMPAGEYFIKIVGNGKTIVPQYSFTVDAPGSSVSASDWARGNDAPGKATPLGVIDAAAVFSGLTLQPEASNWFAFATPRNPSSDPGGLTVRRADGGSLTVTLQDSHGSTIASVTGAGSVTISYPSGAGAAYQVQVQGDAGDYSLDFRPGSGDALANPTQGGGGSGGGGGTGGGGTGGGGTGGGGTGGGGGQTGGGGGQTGGGGGQTGGGGGQTGGGGNNGGGGTSVSPAPVLAGESRLMKGKGRKKKVAGFQLHFSAPLAAGTAGDTGRYRVTQPGRNRKSRPKIIVVRAAQIGPDGRTATIVLGKYNAKKPLTLTATGLSGADGTPIATLITRL